MLLQEVDTVTLSEGEEICIFTHDGAWWVVEKVTAGTWSSVLQADLVQGLRPRTGVQPWLVAKGRPWSEVIDDLEPWPVLHLTRERRLTARVSDSERVKAELRAYLMAAKSRLHDHV